MQCRLPHCGARRLYHSISSPHAECWRTPDCGEAPMISSPSVSPEDRNRMLLEEVRCLRNDMARVKERLDLLEGTRACVSGSPPALITHPCYICGCATASTDKPPMCPRCAG